MKKEKKFDVVLMDMYGVIKFADGTSKNVAEVMSKWQSEGIKIYILSNTTTLNEETKQGYRKQGLFEGIHYTDVLTSGEYASEIIRAGKFPIKGKNCYVFGTADHKNPDAKVPEIFRGSDYCMVEDAAKADFFYAGIPLKKDANGFVSELELVQMQEFLPEIKKLAELNKPMVCANPDQITCKDGRFVIRAGTVAKLFKEEGGNVVYFGKPDRCIFDALLARYCPNTPKDRVLMIGDTLYTDIQGANECGIKSALVLKGGVTEFEMKQTKLDLVNYLMYQDIIPDYVWPKVSDKPLF